MSPSVLLGPVQVRGIYPHMHQLGTAIRVDVVRPDDDGDDCLIDIPAWDLEFMEVDQGTLFELIKAANYLDIKGLLDVTCKKVAGMIKDLPIEVVRKMFNITNDFTPEEEAQIRRENEWCEQR